MGDQITHYLQKKTEIEKERCVCYIKLLVSLAF